MSRTSNFSFIWFCLFFIIPFHNSEKKKRKIETQNCEKKSHNYLLNALRKWSSIDTSINGCTGSQYNSFTVSRRGNPNAQTVFVFKLCILALLGLMLWAVHTVV